MTNNVDPNPKASGPPARRRLTRCSFCGRSNRQTGMQAEGPNDVHICRDCVAVAQRIFADERPPARPNPGRPPPL